MPLTIHSKYKYFDSTVQRAEDRRQKFNFCCLPFAVNVMLNLSNISRMVESGERVRYRVEHEKIKFISTSRHAIISSLYKHTNDNFFDDFPEISEHFAKISEDS